MAGYILMGDGHQPSLGSDGRRLIVAELEPHLPGALFFDFDVQDAFSALVAWTQFRVNAFNAGILLKQLQSCLERFHLQRGAGP